MSENNYLQQIQNTIESIQKLLEANQKDYTDIKFDQLQSAFEQLKNYVAIEIEHSENLQDQKEKFSLQEFKQLREKVEIYSSQYDNRIKMLEENTITQEKVENIINARSEKKWVERSIYIIFFLSLLLSGLGTFFTVNTQVKENDKQIEKNEKNIQENHKMKLNIENLKIRIKQLED